MVVIPHRRLEQFGPVGGGRVRSSKTHRPVSAPHLAGQLARPVRVRSMAVTLELYFKHLYWKSRISQLEEILKKANPISFQAQPVKFRQL